MADVPTGCRVVRRLTKDEATVLTACGLYGKDVVGWYSLSTPAPRPTVQDWDRWMEKKGCIMPDLEQAGVFWLVEPIEKELLG